jgi:hypothetical protein
LRVLVASQIFLFVFQGRVAMGLKVGSMVLQSTVILALVAVASAGVENVVHGNLNIRSEGDPVTENEDFVGFAPLAGGDKKNATSDLITDSAFSPLFLDKRQNCGTG